MKKLQTVHSVVVFVVALLWCMGGDAMAQIPIGPSRIPTLPPQQQQGAGASRGGRLSRVVPMLENLAQQQIPPNFQNPHRGQAPNGERVVVGFLVGNEVQYVETSNPAGVYIIQEPNGELKLQLGRGDRIVDSDGVPQQGTGSGGDNPSQSPNPTQKPPVETPQKEKPTTQSPDTPSTLPTGSGKIHILLVYGTMDKNPTIQSMTLISKGKMLNLLQEQGLIEYSVNGTNVTLTNRHPDLATFRIVDGEQAAPANVVTLCRQLCDRAEPNDAIFIYMMCHGAVHQASGEHVLYTLATGATDLDPKHGVRRSNVIGALLKQTHRLTILMTDACSVVPPNLVPPNLVHEFRTTTVDPSRPATPLHNFLLKGRGIININSSSDKPKPELALGLGYTEPITGDDRSSQYLSQGLNASKETPVAGQKSISRLAEYCDEKNNPINNPSTGSPVYVDVMGTVLTNSFVRVVKTMGTKPHTSTSRFVDDMSSELKRQYATTKRHLMMNGFDATKWKQQTTQTLRVFDESRLY